MVRSKFVEILRIDVINRNCVLYYVSGHQEKQDSFHKSVYEIRESYEYWNIFQSHIWKIVLISKECLLIFVSICIVRKRLVKSIQNTIAFLSVDGTVGYKKLYWSLAAGLTLSC